MEIKKNTLETNLKGKLGNMCKWSFQIPKEE